MRPDRVPPARRLVVLDLDGTVAVGDAPVRAYLGGVVEHLPAPDAERAVDRLAAHLAGEESADGDGYALVADVAAEGGVPDEVREAAYAASRAALHRGALAVTAAPGLAEALARRPSDVVAVLVTNAPAEGLAALLDRFGLVLDGVVGDAGKPAGLPAVLDRLTAEHHLPMGAVLSVGDLWANDLAPAAARGAATAHVDRFGRGDGTPTFRGPTLEALLPEIEGWWTA